VTEPEPLPLDHPLRTLPRVLLTPHAAWYSEEAEPELRRRAARTIVQALRESGLQRSSTRRCGVKPTTPLPGPAASVLFEEGPAKPLDNRLPFMIRALYPFLHMRVVHATSNPGPPTRQPPDAVIVSRRERNTSRL